MSNPDYIIVGAGTSGCLLAHILSKKYSVLILEAGEDRSSDEAVSDTHNALKVYGQDYVRYYWQGDSVGQDNLNDKHFHYMGGRLLGGSSSVNGQQWVRGHIWDKLPYPYSDAHNLYTQIESYNGLESDTEESKMGEEGKLQISQLPIKESKTAKKLVKSIRKATGYNEINNYNITEFGPFTRWCLTSTPEYERQSSDKVYLHKRKNIKLKFKCTVLYLMIDGRKVTGVSYLKDGEQNEVYGSNVILCAGIKSPKILMLSGIGDGDHLRALNMGVIHNNPEVGKNLSNHLILPATFSKNSKDKSKDIYEGGAFLPNKSGKNQYELIGIPAGDKLNISTLLLQMKSKGTIKLQSSDPLTMELVDFNYFSDKEDINDAVYFYRNYLKNIAKELHKIDPKYELLKPSMETINHKDKLMKWMKDNVSEADHFTGTCSIGKVVDKYGKVYGVSNLYVCDDSIMPVSNDGNTQAPAYLMALVIGNKLIEE
jgi:choline dehydrogenase